MNHSANPIWRRLYGLLGFALVWGKWNAAFKPIRKVVSKKLSVDTTLYKKLLAKHMSAADLLLLQLYPAALTKMAADDFDVTARDSFMDKTPFELIAMNIEPIINDRYIDNTIIIQMITILIKKGGILDLGDLHENGAPALRITPYGKVSKKIAPHTMGTTMLKHLGRAAVKITETGDNTSHIRLRARLGDAYTSRFYELGAVNAYDILKDKLKGQPNKVDKALARYLRDNLDGESLDDALLRNLQWLRDSKAPNHHGRLKDLKEHIILVFALLHAGAIPDESHHLFTDVELKELVMKYFSRKRRTMALIGAFKQYMSSATLRAINADVLLSRIVQMSF